MECSKSKSAKVLRKLTSPESRTQDWLTDLSNLKSHEPRRETKPLAKTGVRADSKKNVPRTYLVNRTALGTPHEKSTMLSYLSTPAEKSFNAERLRLARTGLKEQFQSTEEDTFGEDSLRVTLLLPDRRPLSKYFPASQRVGVLAGEFLRAIQEWAEKAKGGYYGFLGF